MSIRINTGRLILVISWLAATAFTKPTLADEPPKKKISPAERMTRPRLKAAHDDVAKLRATRHDVPSWSGLNDYRAILHAHAEDSAHTGGTRPEMLADARKVGVDAILLANHFRPPVDFMTQSWRGLHDGVLFIPGSEWRGFLILPMRSVFSKMERPEPEFIDVIRAGRGLIFLSHIEERPKHSMENLNGLEIYNRHYDAKKDKAGIVGIFLKLTDPAALKEMEENLKDFPDEMLAAQVTRQDDYLAKWDAETNTRRLTGVAANDCHHNQVLIVKMVDAETVLVGTIVDRDDQMRKLTAAIRPGIRAMTKGHKPGDVLARLDFDPYYRSFGNSSTHVFAPELTESAFRSAFREGHAYVSHDWMCNPQGFQFELTGTKSAEKTPHLIMGDEVKFAPGQKLIARFPQACAIKLLNGGKMIAEKTGAEFKYDVTTPGVYRIEASLDVGGESRPWIYSNPIYVR
jgi:hypothetical protein